MQTLAALTTVTGEIYKKNPDFVNCQPNDYAKYLVLSLGAGAAKQKPKYDADRAAKWGLFGWIFNDDSSPILECFTQASSDMVDIHISVPFQTLDSTNYNYLRIQVL